MPTWQEWLNGFGWKELLLTGLVSLVIIGIREGWLQRRRQK